MAGETEIDPYTEWCYLREPGAIHGAAWADYISEAIGISRPRGPWRPEFFHTPVVSADSRPIGQIELWEIRLRWKQSTAFVQYISRPGQADLPPTMAGVRRGTTVDEFKRARAAFDLFTVVERKLERPGGRPARPRALTDREREELTAYDLLKADDRFRYMSDEALARHHLGFGYGHLRYLLNLRKSLS